MWGALNSPSNANLVGGSVESLCLFYDLSVMASLVFSFSSFPSFFFFSLFSPNLFCVKSALDSPGGHVRVCVHVCVCVRVRLCAHVQVCTCVCVCVHAHVCAHMCMLSMCTCLILWPHFFQASHTTLWSHWSSFCSSKTASSSLLRALAFQSSPLAMASKNTWPEVGPFPKSLFIIYPFLLSS